MYLIKIKYHVMWHIYVIIHDMPQYFSVSNFHHDCFWFCLCAQKHFKSDRPVLSFIMFYIYSMFLDVMYELSCVKETLLMRVPVRRCCNESLSLGVVST